MVKTVFVNELKRSVVWKGVGLGVQAGKCDWPIFRIDPKREKGVIIKISPRTPKPDDTEVQGFEYCKKIKS